MGIYTAASYGCVMVDLPESLAKQVRDFAGSIPNSDLYDSDNESGVEGNPHVTVKYGLHTEDPYDVVDVLGMESSVQVTFGRMSVFHNRDFVVLKVSIDSRDLVRLNKKISRELECTDTYPVYRPHMTIAYLKHRDDDPYWYSRLYNDFLKGISFSSDVLRFSTADNEEYDIPLRGTMMASRVAMGYRVGQRFFQW